MDFSESLGQALRLSQAYSDVRDLQCLLHTLISVNIPYFACADFASLRR